MKAVPPAGRRSFLRFGAVQYLCRAWINGVFLDHAADRTVVLEDIMTFFPHGERSAMMMDLFLNPVKPAQYDDQTNCWRLDRNATPSGKPKKLFVNNALGCGL